MCFIVFVFILRADIYIYFMGKYFCNVIAWNCPKQTHFGPLDKNETHSSSFAAMKLKKKNEPQKNVQKNILTRPQKNTIVGWDLRFVYDRQLLLDWCSPKINKKSIWILHCTTIWRIQYILIWQFCFDIWQQTISVKFFANCRL